MHSELSVASRQKGILQLQRTSKETSGVAVMQSTDASATDASTCFPRVTMIISWNVKVRVTNDSNQDLNTLHASPTASANAAETDSLSDSEFRSSSSRSICQITATALITHVFQAQLTWTKLHTVPLPALCMLFKAVLLGRIIMLIQLPIRRKSELDIKWLKPCIPICGLSTAPKKTFLLDFFRKLVRSRV